MFSSQQETDSNLVSKINKGLSMGYDYQLIKTVLEQQTDDDDMSKFIENMVRTAEANQTTSLPIVNIQHQTENVPVHDVYIIDGADLAFSYGNPYFSWENIEICLKYFYCHGHKKVYVVLPYVLKQFRHESKISRDLERKNLLIYTNNSDAYAHINEMLKFTQKNHGYLITNVSLKETFRDFSIYKQIVEEKIIRYRLENDQFQPLLVSISIDQDGNDGETYYPLCPYGKKCTYGFKCKYFHMSSSSSVQPTTQQIKTRNSNMQFSVQSSSVDSQEGLANRIESVRHLWDQQNS